MSPRIEYGNYLHDQARKAMERSEESSFSKYSPVAIVVGLGLIAAALACGFKYGHFSKATGDGIFTASIVSIAAVMMIGVGYFFKRIHDRSRALTLAEAKLEEAEAFVDRKASRELAQEEGVVHLMKLLKEESFAVRHPWIMSTLVILGGLIAITGMAMLIYGGPKHLFIDLKNGIHEWKTMLTMSTAILSGALVIAGVIAFILNKKNHRGIGWLDQANGARFRAGLLKLSAIMTSLVALGLGLYFGHLSLAAKEGIILGATAGAASIGLYYAVTKLSEKHLRRGALAIIFFGGLMLASYLAHAYGVNAGEKIKEGVMTLLHGGYNQALLHFIKTQGFAMAETASIVMGGFLIGHQIHHVRTKK